MTTSKDKMSLLLQTYLSGTKDERTQSELEVRFGIQMQKQNNAFNIGKTEYTNIIRKLKSIGFELSEPRHSLKISTNTKTSNMRVEINELNAISNYCKYADLDTLLNKFAKFVEFSEKPPAKTKEDYHEFGFRISLQDEIKHGLETDIVSEWTKTSENVSKSFRLMNRISATHANFPGFRVDLSVVKSDTKTRDAYNIKETNILDKNTKQTYEIEIEYSHHTDDIVHTDVTLNQMKGLISIIMQGIQETEYPVGISTIHSVLAEYMQLIHKKDILVDKRGFRFSPQPKHFIGPSSISLERKHIAPVHPNNKTVSIQKGYTVTDKADGARKMFFVHSDGRCFFITNSMKVQFTGLSTHKKELFHTLIDGEHITKNRFGDAMNMYTAFDLYFLNKQDKRGLPLMRKDKNDDSSSSRYLLLINSIKQMSFENVQKSKPGLFVTKKSFGYSEDASIFEVAKQFIEDQQNELYDYETDGLIFTPAFEPVGGFGKIKNFLNTWTHSFKWKPPEFNTVDFLAVIVKDSDKDRILYKDVDISGYKTLLLHVGYNPNDSRHGYIQPFNDLLNNRINDNTDLNEHDGYKPALFHPVNPSDENAHICHVKLNPTDNNMYAIDDQQVIEDKTIIECKYDKSQPDGWKWVPIRVRNDKTSQFRSGIKNYGNAYHVANNVWGSIHQPVTQNMICGVNVNDIQTKEGNDGNEDVYYNKSEHSITMAMRDFHNLYVKQRLIGAVTPIDGTIIDLAVGKGGDIPKWSQAKPKFVLGIDVHKDNIHNPIDGACARMLNSKKRFNNMFDAIFLHGNSALNIQTGEAFSFEKEKNIMDALLGKGNHNRQTQEDLVYKYYGIGRDGFDTVSCQFAMHYFFETTEMMHSFIRNTTENCKLNGYFIGTMYDGKTVFNLLKEKPRGEGLLTFIDGKRIWEIRKQYDRDVFPDNETSVGYSIDVFQESINKMFTEYLVNFDYFKSVMYEYGFDLINRREALKMGLPNGSGMFSDLYAIMKREEMNKTNRKLGQAGNLGLYAYQKDISFLNRFFVFKRVRFPQNDLMNNPQKNSTESSINPTADTIANPPINMVEKKLFTLFNNAEYAKFTQLCLKQITRDTSAKFNDREFISFVKKTIKDKTAHEVVSDKELYNMFLQTNTMMDLVDTNPVSSTPYTKHIVSQLKINKIQVKTLLDFGCGDGMVVRDMMEQLKLDKENVYCSDIVKYPSINEDLQFIESDVLESLPKEYFDVITAKLVLHHLESGELVTILQKLFTLLKPGGVFVVQEFAAIEDNRELYNNALDVVHDVYNILIEKDNTWVNKKNDIRVYKTMTEWDNIIQSHGFVITGLNMKNNMNVTGNPTQKYTTIYKRPSNKIEVVGKKRIKIVRPRKNKTVKKSTTTQKTIKKISTFK